MARSIPRGRASWFIFILAIAARGAPIAPPMYATFSAQPTFEADAVDNAPALTGCRAPAEAPATPAPAATSTTTATTTTTTTAATTAATVTACNGGVTRNTLELPAGELLTRYVVDASRKLGESKRNIVLAAADTLTGKELAVKVIDCTHSGFVEWARAECLVMERLSHEHIVRLHAHGTGTGAQKEVYYVVMDLVPHSLYDEVVAQRGALPPERARRLFAQLTAAIAHCQERRVCHRDLKLENVLLGGADDSVRLIDFGEARLPVHAVRIHTACAHTARCMRIACTLHVHVHAHAHAYVHVHVHVGARIPRRRRWLC